MSESRVPAPRRRAALRGLCGLMLAAAATAQAGDLPRLTLDAAVRRAVERAPLLAAARADRVAAEQEERRAGSLPDPMLMLGVDNLPVTGADAFDATADDMTMRTLGLRQDVPARAKREAQRAVARRVVEAQSASQRALAQQVRRETALAWIESWAAGEEAAAIRAQSAQADEAARVATARLAAGAPAADALVARAEALALDAESAGAGARVEAARAALSRWLGAEVDAASPPDFTTLPVDEGRLLAEGDRAAELQAVEADVEAAAARLDLARAQRRPDWSIAATYGHRAGERSDMLGFEVGIALPLFASRRQDRGVDAGAAEVEAAVARRDAAREQWSAQVRADLARWHGLQRQLALHEGARLPLARDRVAVALAAYRSGGEVAAWLDAQRELLALTRDTLALRAELGRAWVALAYLLEDAR